MKFLNAQAFQTKNLEILNKFIRQSEEETDDLIRANTHVGVGFETMKLVVPEVAEKIEF